MIAAVHSAGGFLYILAVLLAVVAFGFGVLFLTRREYVGAVVAVVVGGLILYLGT